MSLLLRAEVCVWVAPPFLSLFLVHLVHDPDDHGQIRGEANVDLTAAREQSEYNGVSTHTVLFTS